MNGPGVSSAARAWLTAVLPAAAVHDLVERSPVEPLERPERPVGRVAERDEECEEVLLWETEDLPSEPLILHGRVARADPEVGRGQHHQHRRVTEVVLQKPGPAIV